jgi:hypothetical protein
MRHFNHRALICVLTFVTAVGCGQAAEIHVSKNGTDSNAGGGKAPYLTIGRAAAAAQAGDTVIVHGGTYREWVNTTALL